MLVLIVVGFLNKVTKELIKRVKMLFKDIKLRKPWHSSETVGTWHCLRHHLIGMHYSFLLNRSCNKSNSFTLPIPQCIQMYWWVWFWWLQYSFHGARSFTRAHQQRKREKVSSHIIMLSGIIYYIYITWFWPTVNTGI